jgi:tetrahydromethanopterin S-methyltransferase subunit B
MNTSQTNARGESSVLEEPGLALALVGLVLSVILPPVGLVVSVSSYRSIRRSGGRGTVAWWGIWIGAIFTALVAFVMVGSLVGGLLAV